MLTLLTLGSGVVEKSGVKAEIKASRLLFKYYISKFFFFGGGGLVCADCAD